MSLIQPNTNTNTNTNMNTDEIIPMHPLTPAILAGRRYQIITEDYQSVPLVLMEDRLVMADAMYGWEEGEITGGGDAIQTGLDNGKLSGIHAGMKWWIEQR